MYKDMGWSELESLPTGELIHAMLVMFDAFEARNSEQVYYQNGSYLLCVEILNERLKKDA